MTSYWDVSEGSACKRKRGSSVVCGEQGGITDIVTVASIEASVLQEIHTTTDDITGGEGRSVGNARPGRTERMSIITMIPIGAFIPTRQSIETDFFRR